jgi:hypothetical protein
MTDITTTAAIAIRRFSLPRPSLPRIGIGASLDAFARRIGDALNLVCVDPFTSRQQLPAAFDDDLEGRDPNW